MKLTSDGLAGEESSCNVGDTEVGLIPGLGRVLGGGNGNPVQYSFCLQHPMDRGACGSQKSQTQLGTKRTHTHTTPDPPVSGPAYPLKTAKLLD